MAFIKEECEDFKIEAVFTVKNEVAEEQIDLMPIKEESEVEEKNHKDLKPHTFTCQQCGKSFGRKSALKRHRKVHFGKRFMCRRCGKRFACERDLQNHSWIHSGKKSQCERRFGKRSDLRNQKEEKPFVRDQSKKAFISASRLKKHQRTHADVEPYLCPTCGKAWEFKTAPEEARNQESKMKTSK